MRPRDEESCWGDLWLRPRRSEAPWPGSSHSYASQSGHAASGDSTPHDKPLASAER